MSTFTLFPLLPAELRNKIWSHHISSIPDRRMAIRSSTTPPSNPSKTPKYTSSAPIPSILHTCYESRLLATQRWLPLFGAFDPKLDTLLLTTDNNTLEFLDGLEDKDLRMLRERVAFDVNQEWDRAAGYGDGLDSWTVALEAVIVKFGGLLENKGVGR